MFLYGILDYLGKLYITTSYPFELDLQILSLIELPFASYIANAMLTLCLCENLHWGIWPIYSDRRSHTLDTLPWKTLHRTDLN